MSSKKLLGILYTQTWVYVVSCPCQTLCNFAFSVDFFYILIGMSVLGAQFELICSLVLFFSFSLPLFLFYWGFFVFLFQTSSDFMDVRTLGYFTVVVHIFCLNECLLDRLFLLPTHYLQCPKSPALPVVIKV